jgi:hypothetical protein
MHVVQWLEMCAIQPVHDHQLRMGGYLYIGHYQRKKICVGLRQFPEGLISVE